MLKSVLLLLVFQGLFLQVVQSAPLLSTDVPVPEDCAEAAKDLLSSSGSGLYSVIHDTTIAAFGATKFCVVECVKIFDKAIKSAMAFNLADVGYQAVKFVECFFRCVKVVLGALGVSFKSTSKFVESSTKSTAQLAGTGVDSAFRLVGAGTSKGSNLVGKSVSSASNLAGGLFNSFNSFVPLNF